MKPDLSLVSTDDLIADLFARCDYGVLAFVQVGLEGQNTFTMIPRWWGNYHACCGLARDLATRIQCDLHETRESRESAEDQ